MKNIFFTDELVKINWFNSEKYFFTDESVKRQITDSISENFTDSDLESISLDEAWGILLLKVNKIFTIGVEYILYRNFSRHIFTLIILLFDQKLPF